MSDNFVWTPRRTWDQIGFRFALRNIPPGDYKIFAAESLGNNALTDPEVFQQYADQAQSVHLKESGDANVEVGIVALGDSTP